MIDTEGAGAMTDDVTFGVLLRRFRLAADHTLEQLAEASGGE